jgi:hypothetical protein
MRYKLNGQFISIDRKYTTADGVTYPHLRSAEVRQQLGVEEVPDAERKDGDKQSRLTIVFLLSPLKKRNGRHRAHCKT